MQKSEKRSKNLLKAMIFGVSITLLYFLVGVIVSLTSAGANFTTVLSTHWIPNLIFFVLFLVFAASLFGVFEIVLPTGIVNKADKQVDKGGLLAAFFMALTTVVVSFSCTGPIVGALLVKAASGNVLEPAIGMLGFGLGFALPFTILAISPNWMKKLPKSGGWLNAVKVIMGFVILAFSLKYFSNIDQNYNLGIISRDVYLAIWIVIFTIMGVYLLGKIKFPHDSDTNHIGFFRLLLAMVSFGFAIYLLPGMFGANLTGIAGLLPPKSAQEFDLTATNKTATDESTLCDAPKYTDALHMAYNVNGYFDVMQGIECAEAQNKPVLLYFTGHSCSNCKKMQAAIWSDDAVNDFFNNKVVMTALYVDEKSVKLDEEEWFTSSNDGKVKKTLGDVNADIQIVNFKTNTQPYYVIMSPDGKVLAEPMTYNNNPEEFLEFLNKGLDAFNGEITEE
jgi:thiol:disulfide interchange protein DsbD